MRWLVLPLSLLLLTAPAHAGDGALEINQACVNSGCFPGDAPGFPVEITSQASYRLTSNLIGTNGGTAISIQASGVTIDFGGFTVGPCTNVSQICPILLEQDGISGSAFNDVTLRNGVVEFFRGDGIDLGQRALVEDMVIRNNTRNGLRVLQNSIVRKNRISNNGGTGASLGAGTSWGGNVLTQNGRNFAGNAFAALPNVCDGRSCSKSDTGRRFYLTSDLAQWADADAACADGYRMAFQAELTNSAALVYQEGLGEDRATALRAGGGGRGYIADRCFVLEFETTGAANVFGEGQWLADDPGSCVFTSGRPVWCIQE